MPTAKLDARLDGIFVPMFTPFTRDGSDIDEEQLRANVRYLVEHGIRLLNPAGTTGEFWMLTPEEHRRLLRIVIEEARAADPDVLVIAGTSCANVTMTVELARFAIRCGADVLQITPPYYLPSSDDDVVAYYSLIAQQVGAPMMPYEIPPATGVRLRGELLARLCDASPCIVGLKTAAAADAPREFERLVRNFRDRLRIFSATGLYYASFTYMTGVAGITDTLANVVPGFGLEIHRLARAAEWDRLNELYQGAFDVLEIELLYGRAGLKDIASACGQSPGPPRFPMAPTLGQAQRADIRRRLRNWKYTRELVIDQPAHALA